MGNSNSGSILHEKISLEYLLGILGLASAFSTALSLLSVFPIGPQLFSRGGAAFVAFFMVLGYFLISVFQEKIATAKFSPLIICESVGFVFACLFCIASFWLPEAYCCVFIAIAALGSSCLSCTWFCWACTQDSAKVSFLVAIGCLFACITCLIESISGATFGKSIMCILYASSLYVAVLMRRKGTTKNLFPYIGNSESDGRSKIKLESTIKFSADSFQFGLIIGIACLSDAKVFCLMAGCVAASIVLIDRVTGVKITERSLSTYSPPLTAAAICALFLFGDYLRIGALCLISALFIFATCVGWMAMAGHVKLSRLSPLRIFSKARRTQYLATAIGILFGSFIMELAMSDWLLSVRVSVVLAFIVTFVFSALHKSRFPEAGIEDDGSVCAGSKGMWMKRCNALGDACGLSERQKEVLILIAQGRSAKYVEQELSISLSTAQTHIRNIYRKVGVHFRQELLDEIEETKLYGED